MANNMTLLQSDSILTCEVVFVRIPTELKTISLRAAMAFINIVTSLFGTLANGLVIMAYYRNPRLRTIQNTIFFLLAITDFCVTAFVQPIFVAAIFDTFLGNHSICIFWDLASVLSRLFLQLSLVTTTILTLQTYITLAYPYRYEAINTKSRLVIIVVSSFLLVSSLTFSVFWRTYFLVDGFAVIVSLSITTVVLTWCWTYKLVARHRRAIQTTQSPSTSQTISRKKILRSTITAFIIIGSLMACYALASFLYLSERFLNRAVFTSETFAIVLSIAMTFVYFNSLLNPCLVFWRSTSFRQTVEIIFFC